MLVFCNRRNGSCQPRRNGKMRMRQKVKVFIILFLINNSLFATIVSDSVLIVSDNIIFLTDH